ncbi:hypothetical protein Q8W71_11665 [Methylobacterium sp. NEAU 140]|uniref:hypothetical protein n=1 Tax=Methylobacterium sp. NEAU 140 TaxID=3064945 RepID=UPI0027338AC9|nr:hypothetical protein [Methylobacterium sp. NEAU 140]MDP4023286.1 hypothetical protein [Methylobacterium sp. NEAU 140]
MSARLRSLFFASGRRRLAARRIARAVLAGLLAVASPGTAGAEDAPVTWAVYAAPPFMIAEGPDRDAGIFDRIRHLLDDRLVGAPAPTLRAPFPRVVASLKEGAEICFIGGVRTPEREDFAVFSLPVAMFYPLRIVVPAAQRGAFEARAPLSLAALLADPGLRTSLLKDRSLGGPIDALLRAAPQRVHSEFGEAFRMLVAERLDYLIEYATIAGYEARSLGSGTAVAALPFAEAPPPVFGRVMCPKTAWGRRLVARIDAVLRVERGTPAYRRIVEAWAEAGDLAAVRTVYDRAFLDGE